MKNDDEEDDDNLTNTFVFNYNTHTHSHREWRPRVTQQWGRLRRRSMYMYTRNWSIKLFYWRSCLAVAVSRPAPRLTEKLFFFGFFFASLSVHWVRLVTTLALLFRHCVYCAQLNDEHFFATTSTVTPTQECTRCSRGSSPEAISIKTEENRKK